LPLRGEVSSTIARLIAAHVHLGPEHRGSIGGHDGAADISTAPDQLLPATTPNLTVWLPD
jgi:hypothetical protein